MLKNDTNKLKQTLRQDLSLKSVQALIKHLVTAPEGPAAALGNMPGVMLPVNASATLTPIERMNIYADSYFYRLFESIKADYQAVCKAIGEEAFLQLLRVYLKTYPPSHYSLRYAGQDFPKFLQTQKLSEAFPYLVDLARFEWTQLDIFDAEDVEILRSEHVQAFQAADWAELSLKTIPAFRLCTFSWPVVEIHQHLMQEKTYQAKPRQLQLQIWRKGFEIFHREVDERRASLLQKLEHGISFAALSEQAICFFAEDKLVAELGMCLQQWLDEEILQNTSVIPAKTRI